MTKELFLASIAAMESQREHDQACAKAFQVLLPQDYTTAYDNDALYEALINVLIDATGDCKKDGVIRYFVWDLDFGKSDLSDSATFGGKPLPMRTAEDLWEFLQIIKP